MIINETETPSQQDDVKKYANFFAIRGRELALLLNLLCYYLIGEPEDPVVIQKKLYNKFQKKTWANKLELPHKLCAFHLKEGEQ